MDSDLLIVARDQEALFDYLLRDFADDPDVTVVLDRRAAERRRRLDACAADRRQAERRRHAPIDPQLAMVGFAIIAR